MPEMVGKLPCCKLFILVLYLPECLCFTMYRDMCHFEWQAPHYVFRPQILYAVFFTVKRRNNEVCVM